LQPVYSRVADGLADTYKISGAEENENFKENGTASDSFGTINGTESGTEEDTGKFEEKDSEKNEPAENFEKGTAEIGHGNSFTVGTSDESLNEAVNKANASNISGMASDEDSENAARQASGLSLSVTYPDQIQCGTPVTFTMTATGGSGNYKYRIHSLVVYEGSERVPVYDISYGSNSIYSEKNTFEFTFWASGTYYIRFSAIDMETYQSVNTGIFEYVLNIQDANYPSVEQIVDDTAAKCLKECTTDFEKAVWLHDWILENADYDYSYSYSSAEGVLARGKGTCEAYHRAYVMLLDKVGIATGRITGNGHVWTAVKMDGDWYQVDSTWDDMGAAYQGTYYEHMYFGLTDSIMGLVHSDHKSSVPGYESTALENNYFIKTGEIARWSEPFAELAKENIESGKMNFSLPVTDTMPDSYKNVIYNLVAYQLSKQSWNGMDISASYEDSTITIKAEAGLTSFVERLYQKTLGRTADAAGLNYWVDGLKAKKLTGVAAAGNFIFSKEFTNKNLSDSAYLDVMYEAMLGRNADAGGKAYWQNYLNDGCSRKYIFANFAASKEFKEICAEYGIAAGSYTSNEARDKNPQITAFVNRMYMKCMGRKGDADGLNYWAQGLLNKRLTGASLASSFIGSKEFTNKNLSGSAYLDVMYEAMFGRKADAGGKAYWQNQMSKGISRQKVLASFINSLEYSKICTTYGIVRGSI